LVPVAVYLLPLVQLLFGGAQLTAALTGLFGLQRAFLEWQKQSNRYLQLWEASANLKTEYYTLRTKWHKKVSSDEFEELFNDMKNATASARAIVRKEQDDFYKSLSATVPVDALNVLKEVQGVVPQLISGGKPPEVFVKQLEAVEKEQKDTYKVLTDQRRMVARIEAELGAVQNRIRDRDREIKDLPASGSDDRKTELKNSLAKLRDERDKKEAELASAKGALAALTTS
jgi:hypothetical protein